MEEEYLKALDYFKHFGGIGEMDKNFLYSQLKRGIDNALVVHGIRQIESEKWANIVLKYIVNN